MNQQFKRGMVAVGLAVAAALSACGGGGDSAGQASNGTADPYVGTWKSRDCSQRQGVYFNQILVVTKQSEKVYNEAFKIQQYSSATCSGAPTNSEVEGYSSVSTIVGTKTVEGVNADKITYVGFNNSTGKSVAYTDGKVLRLGDEMTDLDPDGFPTKFDTSNDEIFDKQ